jgi:hypothetical protein
MGATYYIDTVVGRTRTANSSDADLDPDSVPPWLDDRLKRWFHDVIREPLPRDIVNLLRQLQNE